MSDVNNQICLHPVTVLKTDAALINSRDFSIFNDSDVSVVEDTAETCSDTGIVAS